MAGTTVPATGNIHQEVRVTTFNGFAWLAIGLALIAYAIYVTGGAIVAAASRGAPGVWPFVEGTLVFVAAAFVLAGLYTLQPNEAAILQLFGAYKGTTRVPGLRGTNPFYTRKKISLRARNLNGERLKVNDKRGNPIEIAAVVVWHVDDTAKAAFDVNDYENFVKVQSEAAVRHLASSFAYDAGEGLPDEARLSHLAYAAEIAQVMLRRQQAEAIIAARTKIVHGAVSMVQMALADLSAKKVVELDDERRAAMVSNLMTVLCAESEVQPVINTGTLYNG